MHQQTQQGLDFSIFQKRRLMILQDHQKRRQQLFNKLRNIQESEEPKEQLSDTVSVSEESSPFMVDQIEENPKPMNKDNRRKLHIKIAKLMQQPEWLNFVPEQFNEFYGTVRPRGKKALLVIDGNMASFYDKNGHQLHRVPTLTTNYAGIVLEVYLISKQVSFVSDVLSWKVNNELGEQSFEFRMAWLCSNLPSLKIPHLSLHRLEYYPITRDNLIHLYKNDFGYDKEGLMFVHKDSEYLHGLNPNVLIWKDEHISQYPFEMENGKVTYEIYGVGKIAKSGKIYTSDREWIGSIERANFQGNPKGFLRFSFNGISFEQNQYGKKLELKDFTPVKFKGFSKVLADPLSKLIFQYRIRHDPLKFEQILTRFN